MKTDKQLVEEILEPRWEKAQQDAFENKRGHYTDQYDLMFRGDRRNIVNQILSLLTSARKEAREETLTYIAKDQGWEESENHYRIRLGLIANLKVPICSCEDCLRLCEAGLKELEEKRE